MSLLQPLEIGAVEVNNRIALAPLTRARAVGGIPNEIMLKHYVDRAEAGLLITEGTHISPQAVGWMDAPGIYTQKHVKEWKKITDAVHEAGGKIFVQLWHQGRQSHSDFHDGKAPVAPSAIQIEGNVDTPKGYEKFSKPREMKLDDIKQTVLDYKRASELALEAGFDGAEIHGANGYLIDEFLQSKSNERTDEYGGSFENRYRFCKEVIDVVTEVMGADRTGIRFSPNGMFGGMGSEDNREMFTYVFEQVAKEDLAYVHILDGTTMGFHGHGEPYKLQELMNIVENVQGKESRKTKIIGNAGYTFKTAETAIENGYGDMIAFGTSFMANPDLVNKYKTGEKLKDNYPHKYWFKPGFGEEGYNVAPKLEEPEAEPSS